MKDQRNLYEPGFDLGKAVVWYGYGGSDMSGEWQWSGNDYAEISKGDIGNKYSYYISLYAKRGSNWKPRSYHFVMQVVVAGEKYIIAKEYELKNRKLAFAKMVTAMLEFENSDRFAKEIWPKVIDEKRRTDIVKQMRDGSFQWVASTYGPDYRVLRGENSGFWTFPLGTGRFYVRRWLPDWPSEVLKEAFQQQDISGTCVGSGGMRREELPAGVLAALEEEVMTA